MDSGAVLEELKSILVERLRFDSHRAGLLTLESSLPKGIDGSLGTLVSLIGDRLGGVGERAGDDGR